MTAVIPDLLFHGKGRYGELHLTGMAVTGNGIRCCWPAAKAQKENSRFAERNPVTSLPVRCHSGIRCHSPP